MRSFSTLFTAVIAATVITSASAIPATDSYITSYGTHVSSNYERNYLQVRDDGIDKVSFAVHDGPRLATRGMSQQSFLEAQAQARVAAQAQTRAQNIVRIPQAPPPSPELHGGRSTHTMQSNPVDSLDLSARLTALQRDRR